ncbi:hypothetical protein DAEQUDRAFT_273168 [Daedalea quercina L-15889]|uniref:RING-type domain-containing protein n=1 Tax=Daedalea quercina L-15889 TaxID=1314783 RepID=A0A165QDI2_9APHY|nr:hypothetical protein DAEQUDRAFT_273168 [Daedalea quercina L-15889]
MRPYCGICLDNHALPDFKILHCGHAFCANSLDRLQRRNQSMGRLCECPLCRMPFMEDEIIPIYLQLKDPAGEASQTGADGEGQQIYSSAVLKQAKYVGTKMKEISANSSADTVKRSAKELKKVADGMDGGSCVVKGLLSSIVEFMERISSVYAKLATQKKEINDLHSLVQDAQEDKLYIDDQMRKAEQDRKSALEAADTAQKQYRIVKKELEDARGELRNREKQYIARMSERAGEITKLQATLRAHKEKEGKQQEKINNLKDQLKAQQVATSHARSAFQTPVPSRAVGHYTHSPSRAAHLEYSEPRDDVSEVEGSELGCLDPEHDPPPLPALLPTPPDDIIEFPPLQPKFMATWNIQPANKGKRKRILSSGVEPNPPRKQFPIALDDRGRPKGPVQLGSRRREKFG